MGKLSSYLLFSTNVLLWNIDQCVVLNFWPHGKITIFGLDLKTTVTSETLHSCPLGTCHPRVSQYPILSCLPTRIMLTPIRRKRNFKALQLDVSQPTPPPPNDPLPVKMPLPSATGGKRRPPPMTLKASKIPACAAADPDSSVILTVPNGPSSAPTTGSVSARRMTYHTNLADTLANLDMNAEVKFDLRNEDLKDLQELGQGNGGSVKKVEHTPTNTIMAKKARYSSFFLGLG